LVKAKLQAYFAVQPATQDAGLEALFGGTPSPSGAASIDIPLAAEIQKEGNSEQARKIIVEVIESQKQLKKDSKSASYLLDCCARAQAQLAAAVKDALRPESKIKGVAAQLDQIEALAKAIRAHVDKHVKN
jgi:hypothetical protein